ncbi:hypothetical protein Clacol_002352 [Clathrus columnatus]|uniref:C2H2-type domain-containing protein n=1 Tax=Clathrus columnatus TaxID=1419009 RepID=A0AAV5A0L6_9AGAM|nr:hypothetical protein Clacol_002352 [Clathrus columnatus]
MSASQLNSPPINISIHSDNRFPASPWNEYDTDWKFPPESEMDNHNSNPYTPSYGSFNSLGSRSPSWGGREDGDPMNLYEGDDSMFMDNLSSHSHSRNQNEYDPSQYDGNIVGDMDDIPSVSYNLTGGLNAPSPRNHYSPDSNHGSPASSHSRTSSASSIHHPIPSPPTIFPPSLMNSNPPFSGIKAQSPPALVIPDDVQRQGQQRHLSQRGGLQEQNGMSINIVPSTPIGGLGDPKDEAFPPPTTNLNTSQESWQTHSRHSSTDLPFSFTQHRSPALSAASSLHNSPLPPSMSLPNVGMGGMESTTPLVAPHSLHNSPMMVPMSIPGPSPSPVPSASPAALSIHGSPLLHGSYSGSVRNSPNPTHNRTISEEFLLPESAAHQRPRASSWGEHNAPSIGVTSTTSGGGGGSSLGLNLLSGPSSRGLYPSDTPPSSSAFSGGHSLNDLLQPPNNSVGLGLGLGLPLGSGIRRVKSDAGNTHRKIKSEDLRDYYSGGATFRTPSDSLLVPSPSLGLSNIPISAPNASPGSLSPLPGRSPHLGHRATSSLSIPIGHTVGGSHRASPGFHSQRSSPYPSPHTSPSLRGGVLSNEVDSFGRYVGGGGGGGGGMGYPGGLLNVPGSYSSGATSGGGGGGSAMGLSLSPQTVSSQPGMGIGLANLSISGNHGTSGNGQNSNNNNNNNPYGDVLNPPKKLVTTKATHDASNARRKNDAAYMCPVPGCGSTFTRSFNLKGHLRSHNEERPFKCKWPGCEKGFARQHDCKRHEALHLNIRPYTCTGCKKTFARMDALNRHLRSEGGAECLGEDSSANPDISNMQVPSSTMQQGLRYMDHHDEDSKLQQDYNSRRTSRNGYGNNQNGGGNIDDGGGGGGGGGGGIRGRLSGQQQSAGRPQGQEMDGLIM